MAENSAISWCDHTQNYWVGCTEVSHACDFCYARSWAKRAGRGHLWEGHRERTKDWSGPIKWNKAAVKSGIRAKVFSNSLADFFDNQADPEWRSEAWSLMRATPMLDHLILTKRPQNISKMSPPDWGNGYPNVWLGVTAENQEEYDRRRLHLLSVPAHVHFFSVEPMMSPIVRDLANEREKNVWYICGGESGPKWRPFDLQWAEDLQRSCAETKTPFFFKQDAALKPGQRGRANDDLWLSKQIPESA